MATDEHAFLTSLLDTVTARLSVLNAGGGGGSSSSSSTTTITTTSAPSIRAYDTYIKESLDPFLAAAQALGGQAVELATLVQEAWAAQRDFLYMATAVKQPSSDTQIVGKLGPVQTTIQKAQKAIQRNDYENHAKAIAEGMQALTWVVVRPAPVDFIENFVGASDFWGNKVRIQHKKTEPKHVAFVDTFKKLILELMVYVKEHHTVGVAWNPKGVDIDAYIPSSSSSSGGAPSAPAPAPCPSSSSSTTTTTADASGGRAGLFSQLGKGLAITSGLKKVSKEQQTWRPEYQQNKDGGGGGGAGATSTPPAPAAKKGVFGGAGGKGPKGPPSSVYDKAQFRWNVENYIEGVQQIDVADKNQSVYIYSCGAAIIDIRGKGKSVTLDSCKKTQVLVDEMLSSLEVVNCQGVKVQVRQQVPTVAIDKTDGILVILSKASLGANFLTSKSSEMNIQYPKNEEGELMEVPIPEQWQHTLEGEWPKLRVKNEVSALYSH